MVGKLKSVKFVAWAALFIAASLLIWFGKIDQSTWAETSKWSFIALVAGNGITKIARGFGPNGKQ